MHMEKNKSPWVTNVANCPRKNCFVGGLLIHTGSDLVGQCFKGSCVYVYMRVKKTIGQVSNARESESGKMGVYTHESWRWDGMQRIDMVVERRMDGWMGGWMHG